MESARSILCGRKMYRRNVLDGPKDVLWPEAVKTAAEILNRMITKKSGNKTPHEIWTGRC